MNTVSNNKCIPFSARCPQIKDAQQVCHSIDANLPHISTTKISPFIKRLQQKYSDLYYSFYYNKGREDAFCSANDLERKIFKIFAWNFENMHKLNSLRLNNLILENSDLGKILGILRMLKFSKLGNCYESAKTAELIMKMNGYKNAGTANLKFGDFPIDHVVCVFNRDDSTVKNFENNKTIIIDQWAGCVDFVNNVLRKYNSTLKEHFTCSAYGKFALCGFETMQLTQDEIKLLKNTYPEFVFKK